jgi:hypothetical protein
MSRILLVLAAGLTFVCADLAVSFDANAADMGVGHKRYSRADQYCQELYRCRAEGDCSWYRVCSRACPDGYSCAPLYGAYGPYGGKAYWGAYTDSGWSSYQRVDR